MDLRDYWRPHGGPSRLTARRVMALVDGLPVESATLTAVRDAMTPQDRARLAAKPSAGHGPWSRTELLLAAIADRVSQQTWVLGQWKTRPPAPSLIPRPGVGDDDTAGQGVGRDALRARVSPRTWQVAEALRQGLPIPPSGPD